MMIRILVVDYQERSAWQCAKSQQNGGIEAETPDWLEGYFRGKIGGETQGHEVASLGSQVPVFAEISASLAHEPDRSRGDRFS